MSHFANIAGSTDAAEADTEAKHKSATQKHTMTGRRSLDAGANDDDGSSDKHTHTTAEIVVGGTGEENRRDRSYVIHGKD